MNFQEKQQFDLKTKDLSMEQKAVLFDLVYGRLHDQQDDKGRYTFLNAVKMAMGMRDFKDVQ